METKKAQSLCQEPALLGTRLREAEHFKRFYRDIPFIAVKLEFQLLIDVGLVDCRWILLWQRPIFHIGCPEVGETQS